MPPLLHGSSVPGGPFPSGHHEAPVPQDHTDTPPADAATGGPPFLREPGRTWDKNRSDFQAQVGKCKATAASSP